MPGQVNARRVPALEGIKIEFRRRRKVQWIVSIPAAVLLVFMMPARQSPTCEASGSIWGALAIALALLAFSAINWRCPACDAYLGRSMFVRRCRSCRRELT